jgi:Cu2+-exporting ATPase
VLISEPVQRSRAQTASPGPLGAGAMPASRDEVESVPPGGAPCRHCGSALPKSAEGPFCCTGCEAVHALLHEMDLAKYYDLQGSAGQPVPDARPGARDLKWLEPIEEKLAASKGLTRVDLDIQGIHCTGCVWLIETLFKRKPDGVRALVNPALGKVQLAIGPGFPLRAFLEEVERFGYLLGPPLKDDRPVSSSLLVRMGICIAIVMNAMTFTIAIYAGLDSGPLYRLFNELNLGLSLLSVVVGGSVFFTSAWQGLRRGLLHLDAPIALGILLAFGSSAYAYSKTGGASSYFDTLDVFIALMLVGRWLQERVLEKNRRQLLENDGVEGLLTRRVESGRVAVVRCTEIAVGDALLVAPGDLVPVAAMLDEEEASFSLDWINGEAQPRAFRRGDVVPAGAFAASQRAATVRATEPFSASPLVELLRAPVHREADAARATPWWQRLSRVYVGFVLVAAVTGFSVWAFALHDLPRAIDVVTGVLIVTCPCAFGIATPMAYELAQAGLRRAGLFVRAPGFLDRAASVRRVVFDKTGTLTTGSLVVRDASPLAALGEADRRALYNLASRSTHPKSVAVRRALEALDAGVACAFDGALSVTEHAGLGVEAVVGGATLRFGAPAWVAPGAASSGDVAFGRDGVLLAGLDTDEKLRPDARDEVATLAADGYEVWMLSGDAGTRVAAVAEACGIPAERAVGEHGADEKAAWIRARDRGDTLMVGDGINDSLVVSEAHCSGTPAIDRPFMAARSDFYFTTPGLGPIRLALEASRALARTIRRNLAIAISYNAFTVGLAYTGRMSPVLCAILMPVSSLTVIAFTAASLSKRSALWKR